MLSYDNWYVCELKEGAFRKAQIKWYGERKIFSKIDKEKNKFVVFDNVMYYALLSKEEMMQFFSTEKEIDGNPKIAKDSDIIDMNYRYVVGKEIIVNEIEMRQLKSITCPDCEGSGKDKKLAECWKCKGTGSLYGKGEDVYDKTGFCYTHMKEPNWWKKTKYQKVDPN
jgi:DnaJ-class molecular chaperone